MKQFHGMRPSPAMVLATLALVFALVGTAVAGPDAISDKITKAKTKTIAKKQAKKYFDANIGGASVANATNATNATTAQNAVVGGPRAYALINSDGTVDPAAPSRTITSGNVTNPLEGFYCFDLPFAPTTGAANEENTANNDGVLAFQLIPAEYQNCPATAEVEVTTWDTGDAAFGSDSFYIQLDG